jgi:poly(3-hydroxybutyrate) depolymerase
MPQDAAVKLAGRGWAWIGTVVLASLLAQTGRGGTEPAGTSQAATLPTSYRGLPLVHIPKLAEPKDADAAMSDPAWQQAARVTLQPLVAPIPGAPPAEKIGPELKTEVLLFCTDQNLYVGFICGETSGAAVTTNKADSWMNDDVEIFLEAHGDTVLRPYNQISIDAGGKIDFTRQHIYPAYDRVTLFRETWRPAIKPVIAKTDSGWTCVVHIPFSALQLDDPKTRGQTPWRMNLCRSRPARGDARPISWSWTPLAKVDYQAPARFGFAVLGTFASPDLLARVRTEAAGPALTDEDPLPAWIGETKKLFEPKEFVDSKGRKMMYRIYAPANLEVGKHYPLVVNFHGSGAEGNDNLKQMDMTGLTFVGNAEARKEFTWFVVLPQWPLNTNVNDKVEMDAEFIAMLQKEHPQIDPRRVYATGGSKGASELLVLMSRNLELIAAALPRSTPARPNVVAMLKIDALAKIPLWFFHGEKDPVCNVQEVRDLVKTLRDAGAGSNLKYTEISGGTHDYLGNDFPPIETLRWMWTQVRPEK